MRVFDDILNTLSDGKIHNFDEIFKATKDLNESQVELVLLFIQEYGFVTLHRSRDSAFGMMRVKTAQLDGSMLAFLRKIRDYEDLKKLKETT